MVSLLWSFGSKNWGSEACCLCVTGDTNILHQLAVTLEWLLCYTCWQTHSRDDARENDESRDRALTRVTEKATKVVARRQSVKTCNCWWYKGASLSCTWSRWHLWFANFRCRCRWYWCSIVICQCIISLTAWSPSWCLFSDVSLSCCCICSNTGSNSIEITNRCNCMQRILFLCLVHSTCFVRHTRPSSGVQLYLQPLVQS